MRGLDYYSHTAFEFKASNLGAQSTVLGGGRYDGLAEQMGGPHIPSVGWAAGIERLVMLSESIFSKTKILAIVPLGGTAEEYAWTLAEELRGSNISVHLDYEGSIKSRMKKADKKHAAAALIIGDEEIKTKTVMYKDLVSGDQTHIAEADIKVFLKKTGF